MTAMVNFPCRTLESESLGEVVVKPCRIVLDKLPHEYEEQVSRYLQSSVEQSGQNKVSNEPTEVDSDSGESLFITQKPTTAPVRSRKSRFSIFQEENEDGSSSSTSEEEEPKSVNGKKRKKYKLQKLHFHFLPESRSKSRRTSTRMMNKEPHNSAMGGFFKCIQEIWQGWERGVDVTSSLLTVDTDGASLSPLSEEDEESDKNQDIKVVNKRLFAVPFRKKGQQSRCTISKETKRRKATSAGLEISNEKQLETPAAVTEFCVDNESSDDGEAASRFQADKKRNKEVKTRDENVTDNPERVKTAIPTEREDTLSPGAQAENLPGSGSETHTESVCSETRVKKKKDKRQKDSEEAAFVNVEVDKIPNLSVDNREESLVSQTSDELQVRGDDVVKMASNLEDVLRQDERDVTHVKQKKKKVKRQKDSEEAASENLEVDKIPNLSVDNREESLSDELQVKGNDVVKMASNHEDVLRQDERDVTHVKQKKKKDKRQKDSEEAASENLEVDKIPNLSESHTESVCSEITVKKRKKKKDKRQKDSEEAASVNLEVERFPNPTVGNREESLISQTGDELQVRGEEVVKKASNHEVERDNTHLKRKKKIKNKAAAENMNQEADGNSEMDRREEDSAVLLSCKAENGRKKKKKRSMKEDEEKMDEEELQVNAAAKKERETLEEEEENTHNIEEDLELQNAEVLTKKKKKKKKKKEREVCSTSITEDNVAKSNDSVSVQETDEKRSSSFLSADAEAERGSAGDLDAESAETAGYLDECNDVRKKKKKGKRKMSVSQDVLEKEPNATCLSDLPESTKTKTKRKRRESRSEIVTQEEGAETGAEVGLFLTNEAVVPEKKRKKKKKSKDEPQHVIHERPAMATEDSDSERFTLNVCDSVAHQERLTSPPAGTQESLRTKGKKKKKKKDVCL